MYAFTKIIQMLLLPPGVFLLLMVMGFLIRKECRTMGRLLIGSGFLSLYLVSISPVSFALMEPLERQYKPLIVGKAPLHAEAVVVLAGGVRDLAWLNLAPQAAESSLERTVEGIRIHRATRLPLVLVGGSGDPDKRAVSEADAMARTASGLGVPDASIVVVGGVKNTLESAKALKRREVKGKRIILVTSASHMPRAAGMFRKLGFEVLPAPCGYRAEQRKRSTFSYLPNADCLLTSSRAFAEYISLAWYRMNGEL